MSTSVQVEYPYNSGVGTPQIQFPPGTEIGLLIKGGGVINNFTITMYPQNDPGNILLSQLHSTDFAGNANIPITLPNQALDLVIDVVFAGGGAWPLTFPSVKVTLNVSTNPLNSKIVVAVQFNLNGTGGVPVIGKGTTVSGSAFIPFNLLDYTSKITYIFGEYQGGTIIAEEQNIATGTSDGILTVPLNSFVAQDNDGISYTIFVNGIIQLEGNEIFTQPPPPAETSVTGLTVTATQAAEGSPVSFSASITNISSNTIQVQAMASGPSDTSISPTTPFQLAPNQVQVVSGSFIMPGLPTGVVTVRAYVNGDLTQVDSEEQATITLLESPALTIEGSSKVLLSDASLTIDAKGFLPTSSLSITVIDSAGDATYIGAVATDNNGEYYGTAPTQIVTGDKITGGVTKVGNYTLQVSDVNNYMATAPFTVTEPMPEWEKILIWAAVAGGIAVGAYVIGKVADIAHDFRRVS